MPNFRRSLRGVKKLQAFRDHQRIVSHWPLWPALCPAFGDLHQTKALGGTLARLAASVRDAAHNLAGGGLQLLDVVIQLPRLAAKTINHLVKASANNAELRLNVLHTIVESTNIVKHPAPLVVGFVGELVVRNTGLRRVDIFFETLMELIVEHFNAAYQVGDLVTVRFDCTDLRGEVLDEGQCFFVSSVADFALVPEAVGLAVESHVDLTLDSFQPAHDACHR